MLGVHEIRANRSGTLLLLLIYVYLEKRYRPKIALYEILCHLTMFQYYPVNVFHC